MITNENYFSPENNMKYMGVSQLKSFMNCEAAAMAELKGEYIRPKTTSLLVGSYVDAHFSGTLDLFKAQNPEIFTKQGALKSEYRKAEEIINRIERDPLFAELLSGKQQVIKTGELFGVPFKIKIDSYHHDKIVDLKIMKDFAPIYVEGKGRVSFIEAWGYDIQGAIYRAIEGNNLPFIIAAATKETEPDIGAWEISSAELDAVLEMLEPYIQQAQLVKSGVIEPERCEHCDYCKFTKVLTEIGNAEDLQYAE